MVQMRCTEADCTWHMRATATGKAGLPTVRMGGNHKFKEFTIVVTFGT